MMILDGGDHQGLEVTDKGPGAIVLINRKHKLHFRSKKFPTIDPGLDLVRGVIKAKCACGNPFFMVHRRCTATIGALGGGYHYPKPQTGRPVTQMSQKPVKDGYFDNVADTIRMAGQLFYLPASRDPDFMKVLSQDVPGKAPLDTMPSEDEWGWVDKAVIPNA